MPGLADAERTRLLDLQFMNAAYAMRTQFFVALSTTTPTDDGGNFNRPVGGGYADVTSVAANWNQFDAVNGVRNGQVLDFGTATGAAWGTVVAFGFWAVNGSVTLADCIGVAPLTTNRTIADGTQARFPANSVQADLTVWSVVTREAWLEHSFMLTAHAQPTNLYVGVSTTTADDDGGNFTRPVGGGYVDQTTGPGSWTSHTVGIGLSNVADIDYGTAGSDWGELRHFGIFTVAGGGSANYVGGSALDTFVTVNTGESAKFEPGKLVCDLIAA